MSKIQYQEDQAERIYECLFSKGKDRYLLADEVGLGKTVTSARVIYKFAKISKKPIINIGYICGNKALAIQNIKKLRERILECDSEEKTIEIVDKPAENLSLGFLTLGDRPETESKKKIVIHVITPSTTIKTLSEGTVRERAYAYCLITGNKDDKNKDDFLWEACLGKASEETFVKELKKVNICGFEKYNSSLYHFKINFKDRIKIEWQKEKEKCLEKCKDECLKQIFCEGNLSKKNIKNYYEKIREEKQKKDTEERLSDYLKAIEEENQGVFTKEYLKELSGKLSGEKSSDISRKERKTSEDIEEGLSDIIIKYVKEYIKLARKCMAVSSVKAMQMDLFVADEIQNYSELFKTIKEGNTELGLVVQEIIQGNQKLLLMSATPFRYHSKQSDLENENKEKEADDNDDEKSDDSESESSNIKGQDYLEK